MSPPPHNEEEDALLSENTEQHSRLRLSPSRWQAHTYWCALICIELILSPLLTHPTYQAHSRSPRFFHVCA